MAQRDDYPTLGKLLGELSQLKESGAIEGGAARIKGGGKFRFGRGAKMGRLSWPGVGDFWLDADQQQVVAVLLEAYFESKVPDVSQRVLLAAIGSKAAHLRDVFKDAEAWGKLVVAGATAGTYRLAAPAGAPVEDDEAEERGEPDEWVE